MLADIGERLARYRRFFASREPGKLLVIASFPGPGAKGDTEWSVLSQYVFPAESQRYLGHYLHAVEREIKERAVVADDWIPACWPDYGIGQYAAIVSPNRLRFGEDTSWIEPCIHDWSDLDRLTLSEDNPWFRMQRESMLYLRRGSDGLCFMNCVSLGPLDMANALRGNALFTDFYDSPDQVHRLMDFCVGVIVWYSRMQKEIIPDVGGGLPIWNGWVPGNAVMMSEDAPDLCGSRVFAEFGRPYTQRVIDQFGSCFIHHHALGRQVHGEIAKLSGLQMLEISKDPNVLSPVSQVDRIAQETAGMPLMITCNDTELYQNIEKLKSTQTIVKVTCDDLRGARTAVDFVRQHSSI